MRFTFVLSFAICAAFPALGAFSCWNWLQDIATRGPRAVVGEGNLPIVAGVTSSQPLAEFFSKRNWQRQGSFLVRDGEKVALVGVSLFRLPPTVVEETFFYEEVFPKPLNCLSIACGVNRGAPYETSDFVYRISGYVGDLTAFEIESIQQAVDGWREMLAVFGSAARSERKDGSDIDYWFPFQPPRHAEAVLPAADGKYRTAASGLPYPAIIFSPHARPIGVKAEYQP